MNWTKGHICEAHWSSGFRKDTDNLPDIAVPKDQLNKLEQKYLKSQKNINISKDTISKTKVVLQKSKAEV